MSRRLPPRAVRRARPRRISRVLRFQRPLKSCPVESFPGEGFRDPLAGAEMIDEAAGLVSELDVGLSVLMLFGHSQFGVSAGLQRCPAGRVRVRMMAEGEPSIPAEDDT